MDFPRVSFLYLLFVQMQLIRAETFVFHIYYYLILVVFCVLEKKKFESREILETIVDREWKPLYPEKFGLFFFKFEDSLN